MHRQLVSTIDPPRAARAKEEPQASERFQTSIEGLLDIVREDAGALGYALYELEEAKGTLVFRCGDGIRLGEERADSVPDAGDGLEIVSLPLKGETSLAGILDFAFRRPASLTPALRAVLEHTAETIGALLRRSRSTSELILLTARIARLETQLADLKIAERAAGLARQAQTSRRSELLHAHVTTILHTREFEELLTARVRDLEQRLDERRVVSKAKAALQSTLRLTEEEAYLHLRLTSRRTRRRLIVVAREVLDGNGSATVLSHADAR